MGRRLPPQLSKQLFVMTQLNGIGAQLAEHNQWVLWREEERNGNPTKMPYQPNGKKAKTTEPSHWVSAAEIWSVYNNRDDFSGVGFVFTEDDPFVGIDLDHCMKGDDLKPWAQEIVDRLDSYTEKSPSGDGVHIIVEGELPPGGNRNGNVEMYDAKRYFTVTGAHTDGTPGAAKDRQDALVTVHQEHIRKDTPSPSESDDSSPSTADTKGRTVSLSDEELLAKIRESDQAPRFELLWSGNTSLDDSPSEADLALASILAFWTGGDRERVDRLFRQSELYRDKWERESYREKTLDTAHDQEEYYNPKSANQDRKYRKYGI